MVFMGWFIVFIAVILVVNIVCFCIKYDKNQEKYEQNYGSILKILPSGRKKIL